MVGTHHLGTVHLHHMTTVKIADRSQDLSQFTGDGCLACSRVASKNDVHAHLLLLTQPAFCTLNTVLHGIGYLPNGTLHLIHANEMVKILQDIIDCPLLRHIARNIVFFHLSSIDTATDEMGEDILCCLCSQMTIAKGLVLGLHLILEETG